MFKFDSQCNPRQISLTGVRAIVILALLNVKPCTFEEIKDFLIASNIVTREYSIDTIRIDLNTLKYIGCEISKAIKRTDNKYTLLSHPFQLVLTEEEVAALAKIYKHIYKNLSLDRLLEYDNLFEKLADTVNDEEIKEQLKGISVLKGLDNDLVKEILKYAKKHTRIKISYAAGNTKEVEYDITIEKLGFRSDKLYMYCFNHSINKRMFLNFSRLKKIICRSLTTDDVNSDDTVVEFILKNYKNHELDDSEQIISTDGDTATVKGSYYTDFIALQRVLFFGADCVIESPSELKENLIEKLHSMRQQYD